MTPWCVCGYVNTDDDVEEEYDDNDDVVVVGMEKGVRGREESTNGSRDCSTYTSEWSIFRYVYSDIRGSSKYILSRGITACKDCGTQEKAEGGGGEEEEEGEAFED